MRTFILKITIETIILKTVLWYLTQFEKLKYFKIMTCRCCACRIGDILLTTAVSQNTGFGRAIKVEDCSCPTGYSGLSCEVGTSNYAGLSCQICNKYLFLSFLRDSNR